VIGVALADHSSPAARQSSNHSVGRSWYATFNRRSQSVKKSDPREDIA
jgi:hypothetical protein